MGLIETVILLSLWTYQGEERKIEGWYHQDNIGTCLKAKRYAEKNAGRTNKYTCSIEQCVMKTDQTGFKHCDKIMN